jgi:hypothetical protein
MTPAVGVPGTGPGRAGAGRVRAAGPGRTSRRPPGGRAGPADAAGTSLKARGVMSRALPWMAAAAVLAAAVTRASAGCGHPQAQVVPAGVRALPAPAWPAAHCQVEVLAGRHRRSWGRRRAGAWIAGHGGVPAAERHRLGRVS